MAKASKIIVRTPAEIKALKADLKAAAALIKTTYAPFVAEVKAANSALALAKKEADKVVATAQKSAEAASKKLAKADEARNKGEAKIAAQRAALVPVAAEAATV